MISSVPPAASNAATAAGSAAPAIARLAKLDALKDYAAFAFLLLGLVLPLIVQTDGNNYASAARNHLISTLFMIENNVEWVRLTVPPKITIGAANIQFLVVTILALIGVWIGFFARRLTGGGWIIANSSRIRTVLQIPLFGILFLLIGQEMIAYGITNPLEDVNSIGPGATLSFAGAVLAAVPRETDRSTLAAKQQGTLKTAGEPKLMFGIFALAFGLLTICGILISFSTRYQILADGTNFMDSYEPLAALFNTIECLLYAAPFCISSLLVTILLVGVMRRKEAARRLAICSSVCALLFTPLRMIYLFLVTRFAIYTGISGETAPADIWRDFRIMQARIWNGFSAAESTHFTFGLPLFFLCALLGLLLHPGVKALMVVPQKPVYATAKLAASRVMTFSILFTISSFIVVSAAKRLNIFYVGMLSGSMPEQYAEYEAIAKGSPIYDIVVCCILVALLVCTFVFNSTTGEKHQYTKKSAVITCVMAGLALLATILHGAGNTTGSAFLPQVWWFAIIFLVPLLFLLHAHGEWLLIPQPITAALTLLDNPHSQNANVGVRQPQAAQQYFQQQTQQQAAEVQTRGVQQAAAAQTTATQDAARPAQNTAPDTPSPQHSNTQTPQAQSTPTQESETPAPQPSAPATAQEQHPSESDNAEETTGARPKNYPRPFIEGTSDTSYGDDYVI